MRRKKKTTLKLGELAERIGGEVVGRASAASAEVGGISTLSAAEGQDLTFLSGKAYLDEAAKSQAAALLIPEEIEPLEKPCLRVPHLWKAVLACLDIWYPEEPAPRGIHPSAVVDPSAEIGENVAIGPLCVIEAQARIGSNTEIGAQCFVGRASVIGADVLVHPSVRVLESTEVGDRVILHSGVVLGADGFGYEVMDGRGVKIPQVGRVVIESDVEIGANSCVDRAFLTETRIGAGTKIDNLVQVAHNCRIGRSCGIASQVGIAGSSDIGDGCIFWGQVGVKDHIKIGNGVTLMGQSAPKDDVPDGASLVGSPAYPLSEAGRIMTAQRQLPDILKRLRRLEKKVEKG